MALRPECHTRIVVCFSPEQFYAPKVCDQIGGGGLGLIDEFQKNADECFRLSENAISLEARAHWLSMAQFWLKLAMQTEEQDAISAIDPAIDPENGKSNGDHDKKN
jgi:hypothetical protein